MIGSVAELLRPALTDRPDAPAIVARSGALSYAELDRAADAAAAALWSLGVRPGDRVAACLPNDVDIVIAFHGAERLGAIWLGIAEAYARPEQEALRTLTEPAVVLAGAESKMTGRGVVPVGRWRQLLRSGAHAPSVTIDPFAPAAIGFTSGTTGRPRAVVHSQYNLVLPGTMLCATRGWGPDLRKGDSMPMTILNLLILNTLSTAQAQGCAVLIDRRDVGGIAERIAEHRVTVWNAAAAQLYDLARRPELDLSSLQELWSGGSDCPDELRVAVRETHGLAVHSTYGQTEAPTVVAIDPTSGATRPRASGVVLPHLDVATFDDQGVRLSAGEVGEFRVAAARTGAWAGAWRPPLGEWRAGTVVAHEPPDAVVTGDIGTVSADGWLTVLDRKKLVIVRGGANVYPAEVERVIRLDPRVEAVAVFGVPDERLGERVAALVVADPSVDAAELSSLCCHRLARYKVPEIWGRVDRLQTNSMGKLKRSHLLEVLRSAAPLDES